MRSHHSIDDLFLRLALTRPLDTYAWVLASAAFATWDGKTRCLFVSFQLGDGPMPLPREPLRFPNLRFWEGPAPLADALSALRRRGEGVIHLDGCEVRLGQDLWRGHSPTSFFPAYLQPNPCFHAQTRLRNDPVEEFLGFEELLKEMMDEAPISCPGGPHFVDVLAAVQDWFGWVGKLESGDSKFGSIQVIAPPPPGHVHALRLRRDGRLVVELVPGLDPTRTAVSAAWEVDGDHWTGAGSREGDSIVFPACPQGKFSVYVYCDDSLVAYYRGHPYNIESEPHAGIEREVLDLLRAGESETVEFKEVPSTQPSELKDGFWHKLVRVVASFGNAQGGSLILGATDEGAVAGIAERLRTTAGPTDQASKLLHTALQKRLQDDLTYKPLVDMQWETVNEKLILLVRVAQNEPGVVTSLKEGGIPIRKGSTTRLADSDECRQLFGRRRPF